MSAVRGLVFMELYLIVVWNYATAGQFLPKIKDKLFRIATRSSFICERESLSLDAQNCSAETAARLAVVCVRATSRQAGRRRSARAEETAWGETLCGVTYGRASGVDAGGGNRRPASRAAQCGAPRRNVRRHNSQKVCSYAEYFCCCVALRRGRRGALKRSEATAKACAGGRPADAGRQAESALLGVDTGCMVASGHCQRVASGVATCCK
jgi:hypothetical protein